MDPLISVIIPVYNTSNYLEKCIYSIVNQSYDKLEIIIVDDGSKDESGEICNKIKKEDKRIVVIHKENEGLSSARNTGIARSTGELLTFVDSDDYVRKDYVLKMIDAIARTGAQIVQCSMKIVHQYEEQSTPETIQNFKTEFSGKDAILNRSYKVSACAKLFKRDLFDDLEFPTGYNFEDEATYYKLAIKCNKICIISDPLYLYYQAPNSITRTTEMRLDFIKVGEERIKFFAGYGDAELLNNAYERYGITLILNHGSCIKKKAPKEIQQDIIRRFMEIYEYIDFRQISIQEKILLGIYHCQPDVAAWLLSKIRR